MNEKRDGMREMRDWRSYPRNVAISGPSVTTGWGPGGALPDTRAPGHLMVIIEELHLISLL